MKLKIFAWGLFVSTFGFGQQNTVATGGAATGSGGTATYSVGQIDYKSNGGTNGSSSEGVQQPFEFYSLDIHDAFASYEVNLYPNPSSSFINLSIANWKSDQSIMYQLCDLNGKILNSNSVVDKTTVIDVQHLADAQYFLYVFVKDEIAKTFKLIKNN